MRSKQLIVLTSLLVFSGFAQAVDESKAEDLVKNSPCLDSANIEAVLTTKIKTGS